MDDSSIKVDWTDAGGTESQYNIYRKTGAETTTLSDYSKIAEVSGSTNTYTDTGLSANTQYAYAVTQVVDGDESPIDADSADDATTLAAGSTAAPESTDAYLQTDGTFQGEISAGDVWRVIFNKQMKPVVNGDTIRVQDAQGEILNVVCETTSGASTTNEAVCQFNTGSVTIGGTTYEAGRVLTVTMETDGDFTADNSVTGASDRLEYPVTITNQSGFTDSGDRAWTPTDDPDNVIDDEGTKTTTGTTFTGDTPAPTLASASGSGTSVTSTWSEAVDWIGAVGDSSPFVRVAQPALTARSSRPVRPSLTTTATPSW